VLVHVDAGNGSLAHSNSGASVGGNQAADKLEQVGIMADNQDVLAIRVFFKHLLKGGEVRLGRESRTDLNLAFVPQLVAHKLRSLQGALQWARDDQVWLYFKSIQNAAHHHALFFAFFDETALGVEFRTLAGYASIGVAHQV